MNPYRIKFYRIFWLFLTVSWFALVFNLGWQLKELIGSGNGSWTSVILTNGVIAILSFRLEEEVF